MVSGKLKEEGKIQRDWPLLRSLSLGRPLETTPTRTLELGVGFLGVWEAGASSGSWGSEGPLGVWEAEASSGSSGSERPLDVWEAEASSGPWGSGEPLESLLKIYWRYSIT